MSFPADCPSCRRGDHQGHDPRWGIIEGLLGGQSCGCVGDCAERHAEDSKIFKEIWNSSDPYKKEGGE